jgi:hypothetical protein
LQLPRAARGHQNEAKITVVLPFDAHDSSNSTFN